MRVIQQELYPNKTFSKAIGDMKDENLLVVLNKGAGRKKYSVMDKIYKSVNK